MERAAFVLAGGRSSRMGTNKAFLPLQGRTLLEHVISQTHSVARDITLIGNSGLYINLGYPVIEDFFVGCGPLGGIHAALASTTCEWNLILACDMPAVTGEFLQRLMERAETGSADAVIPLPREGPEPLCAAYRRRCAGVVTTALQNGVRKVIEGFAGLDIDYWPVSDSHFFRNLNNPQDWALYTHDAR